MRAELIKRTIESGYAAHIDYCLKNNGNPLSRKQWEEKKIREIEMINHIADHYGEGALKRN